jgi:hypothetical protein
MIREKGLGLKHFDAVAGHLVAAMKGVWVWVWVWVWVLGDTESRFQAS